MAPQLKTAINSTQEKTLKHPDKFLTRPTDKTLISFCSFFVLLLMRPVLTQTAILILQVLSSELEHSLPAVLQYG